MVTPLGIIHRLLTAHHTDARLPQADVDRLHDLQAHLERGNPIGAAERRWLEELARKYLEEAE